MGNCCDFIEHDVRDKNYSQQQGTILSKRVHNVFKDKSNHLHKIIIFLLIDDTLFKIERHNSNITLA